MFAAARLCSGACLLLFERYDLRQRQSNASPKLASYAASRGRLTIDDGSKTRSQ
jgi:hypothetical protein